MAGTDEQEHAPDDAIAPMHLPMIGLAASRAELALPGRDGKSPLHFACRRAGFVRIKTVKSGEAIAEDRLPCGFSVNKSSMEFAVPSGADVWIIQEPSAHACGIREVMFYSQAMHVLLIEQ